MKALEKIMGDDNRVRKNLCRRVKARFPGITLEPNVQFKGSIDNLELGPGVVVQYGCVLHLGGMDWCERTGKLVIGEGSILSPYCVIYGCGPGGVTIGRNCDLGPYVGIFASRTDYRRGPGNHVFGPVIIGDDVTVYSHCVIGPGVTIGRAATIAAGSVVTEDVPEGCLAGGAPARVLRDNVRDSYVSNKNGGE